LRDATREIDRSSPDHTSDRSSCTRERNKKAISVLEDFRFGFGLRVTELIEEEGFSDREELDVKKRKTHPSFQPEPSPILARESSQDES